MGNGRDGTGKGKMASLNDLDHKSIIEQVIAGVAVVAISALGYRLFKDEKRIRDLERKAKGK
jgi:hypothetical protein